MLIGNVLEETDAVSAWQLCADKLADWSRSVWMENTAKKGLKTWEISIMENPGAIPGLREEGFKGLVGLDYILKWWGPTDSDELGGELDAIWKVMPEDGGEIECYRTWIRLAGRDFLLGLYKDEGSKREYNREQFRSAFAQWKELFNR